MESTAKPGNPLPSSRPCSILSAPKKSWRSIRRRYPGEFATIFTLGTGKHWAKWDNGHWPSGKRKRRCRSPKVRNRAIGG
jgi:hypothetical protein